MMFNVVYALGELAVMYPVSGGFYTYSARFIDPTWGFAMGWNYVVSHIRHEAISNALSVVFILFYETSILTRSLDAMGRRLTARIDCLQFDNRVLDSRHQSW